MIFIVSSLHNLHTQKCNAGRSHHGMAAAHAVITSSFDSPGLRPLALRGIAAGCSIVKSIPTVVVVSVRAADRIRVRVRSPLAAGAPIRAGREWCGSGTFRSLDAESLRTARFASA